MKTVLLTGTRAPATLDLARRLRRGGVRVIGADPFRFPLGRFSRAFASHHRIPAPNRDERGFIDAILTLIEKERVELLVPTCEEIFHLAASHERLAAATRLFFEPLSELLPLHDKLAFARLAGAFAPASWPAAEAPRDRRLVWKPRFSRFAARVRFDDPPLDPEGWMAQEFIDGEEFSTWSLCAKGGVRVMTGYRCPARLRRGAGTAFEPFRDEEAIGFVQRLAAERRFTGSLAFDWIRSREGKLHVIECNPRLTSGIHVLGPSIPLPACFDENVSPDPAMQSAQLLWPTLFRDLRIAGTSPDVILSSDDLRPSFGQALAFGELSLRALRHRESLSAAATRDIEFNGP